MDAATRQLVRKRASLRCEYCHLPQSAIDAAFHIEHIVARQHGGDDDSQNLALACDRCNLAKGPNLSGIDPQSGIMAALFHPRHQAWEDHFELIGSEIAGRTPTGRCDGVTAANECATPSPLA
jgi:hypothetical protein